MSLACQKMSFSSLYTSNFFNNSLMLHVKQTPTAFILRRRKDFSRQNVSVLIIDYFAEAISLFRSKNDTRIVLDVFICVVFASARVSSGCSGLPSPAGRPSLHSTLVFRILFNTAFFKRILFPPCLTYMQRTHTRGQ